MFSRILCVSCRPLVPGAPLSALPRPSDVPVCPRPARLHWLAGLASARCAPLRCSVLPVAEGPQSASAPAGHRFSVLCTARRRSTPVCLRTSQHRLSVLCTARRRRTPVCLRTSRSSLQRALYCPPPKDPSLPPHQPVIASECSVLPAAEGPQSASAPAGHRFRVLCTARRRRTPSLPPHQPVIASACSVLPAAEGPQSASAPAGHRFSLLCTARRRRTPVCLRTSRSSLQRALYCPPPKYPSLPPHQSTSPQRALYCPAAEGPQSASAPAGHRFSVLCTARHRRTQSASAPAGHRFSVLCTARHRRTPVCLRTSRSSLQRALYCPPPKDPSLPPHQPVIASACSVLPATEGHQSASAPAGHRFSVLCTARRRRTPVCFRASRSSLQRALYCPPPKDPSLPPHQPVIASACSVLPAAEGPQSASAPAGHRFSVLCTARHRRTPVCLRTSRSSLQRALYCPPPKNPSLLPRQPVIASACSVLPAAEGPQSASAPAGHRFSVLCTARRRRTSVCLRTSRSSLQRRPRSACQRHHHHHGACHRFTLGDDDAAAADIASVSDYRSPTEPVFVRIWRAVRS